MQSSGLCCRRLCTGIPQGDRGGSGGTGKTTQEGVWRRCRSLPGCRHWAQRDMSFARSTPKKLGGMVIAHMHAGVCCICHQTVVTCAEHVGPVRPVSVLESAPVPVPVCSLTFPSSWQQAMAPQVVTQLPLVLQHCESHGLSHNQAPPQSHPSGSPAGPICSTCSQRGHGGRCRVNR